MYNVGYFEAGRSLTNRSILSVCEDLANKPDAKIATCPEYENCIILDNTLNAELAEKIEQLRTFIKPEERIIKACFEKAGVFCDNTEHCRRLITNLDFYEYGLSGKENSKEKRKMLLKKLDLPERMSSSSMIKILNTFITFEEFQTAVKEIEL